MVWNFKNFTPPTGLVLSWCQLAQLESPWHTKYGHPKGAQLIIVQKIKTLFQMQDSAWIIHSLSISHDGLCHVTMPWIYIQWFCWKIFCARVISSLAKRPFCKTFCFHKKKALTGPWSFLFPVAHEYLDPPMTTRPPSPKICWKLIHCRWRTIRMTRWIRVHVAIFFFRIQGGIDFIIELMAVEAQLCRLKFRITSFIFQQLVYKNAMKLLHDNIQ